MAKTFISVPNAVRRKRKFAREAITMLSPAEKEVYYRLLEGKTARGIAKELKRSPFTISNHTRKIFAAFKVNSRSQILAFHVVPIE